MFEHGDYVYIAYAGATVDKYYNTNVMRAAKNADLQDLSSWTTADFPSFDTNDTYTGAYGADEASYERKQAGPGHISLAHDEPATSSWPTTHAPTRKFTPVPQRVACSIRTAIRGPRP